MLNVCVVFPCPFFWMIFGKTLQKSNKNVKRKQESLNERAVSNVQDNSLGVQDENGIVFHT